MLLDLLPWVVVLGLAACPFPYVCSGLLLGYTCLKLPGFEAGVLSLCGQDFAALD